MGGSPENNFHSTPISAGKVEATSALPLIDVPLDMWLGPIKVASFKFHVQRENCPFGPSVESSAVCVASPPDLALVPENVAGVYRLSEPQQGDGPVLRISRSSLRYVASSYRRRFIDFSTGFDNYMAGFSSKTRSTLRRKIRKFEKASGGNIDWRPYRQVEELDEFHAHARAVSALTYQEKLYNAGIPDDAVFKDRMRDLAAANSLRAYVLFLDGKPVAYLYCPIEEGRVIYGFLGFDPGFSTLSPGTVLQLLVTESLFSENCYLLFDFTEGEGAHKELFSTGSRLCANVFYFRPGVKSLSCILLHLSCRWISGVADRAAEWSGLKTRLRQRIRGQEN
jgi:hypothetical protein